MRAYIFAWDDVNDVGLEGDAANITATISRDGGSQVATNDTNPTEVGGGVYYFDLTAAEQIADVIIVEAASSTPDVIILPEIIHIGLTATEIASSLTDYDITPVSAMSSDGELNITVGATLETTISGLTIPASWEEMHLMIKHKLSDEDSAAKVHILVTNGGDAGDGLQLLNGASSTASWGSLTVDQPNGEVDVYLADDAAASLEERNKAFYAVKYFRNDGESFVAGEGVCNVNRYAMVTKN